MVYGGREWKPRGQVDTDDMRDSARDYGEKNKHKQIPDDGWFIDQIPDDRWSKLIRSLMTDDLNWSDPWWQMIEIDQIPDDRWSKLIRSLMTDDLNWSDPWWQMIYLSDPWWQMI